MPPLAASGVSRAMYSGISTPPMSFMTCIIGGMRAGHALQEVRGVAAAVAVAAAVLPDDDLVELDVRDRLGRRLGQRVEVFEHQQLERLLRRRRRPR